MTNNQQELMDKLYITLKLLAVEYTNDSTFKVELDKLNMFSGNIVDASNTITSYETYKREK